MLKPREEAILEFIRNHLRQKGYPPSLREIGRAVGLSSPASVHFYVTSLEEKGLLFRDPKKPRALLLREEEAKGTIPVPLVGRVAAGTPILAQENIEEYVPIPETWVKSRRPVFFLEVRGDSMVGAGILDGDWVLVQQQSWAEDGEIVVALLGEEATVKRFYREKDAIRLQPENPRLEPIRARDIQVLGKVIGLYRPLV
ncbi:MAG: transcriptional repressor LexA [Bacillota bacterium]|nr:transcriptional repressor LexA [Bacillota bacterium]